MFIKNILLFIIIYRVKAHKSVFGLINSLYSATRCRPEELLPTENNTLNTSSAHHRCLRRTAHTTLKCKSSPMPVANYTNYRYRLSLSIRPSINLFGNFPYKPNLVVFRIHCRACADTKQIPIIITVNLKYAPNSI